MAERYNKQIHTAIIDLRREEGLSARRISLRPGFPGVKTIDRWFKTKPGFRQDWEQATLDYADDEFDDLDHLAENATPEDWQVQKLKIDTKKWQLARRNQMKFGEGLKVSMSVDVAGDLTTALAEAERKVREAMKNGDQ